jgi:enolase
MNKTQISKCYAREILDSRGNPTVEATVVLNDGSLGLASAPSGASTGIYEAHELRDMDQNRFGGKGVRNAVQNVNELISPAIKGLCATEQAEIDRILLDIDGTDHKEHLGANATLAVSLACARAAANSQKIPLYRYLGGINASRLPIPMMNILNGGAHASNNVEIQEFMIVPMFFESYSEALRAGCEITHTLGDLLRKNGFSTAIGDEGGFAPMLSDDEEAIEWIVRAIHESGYDTDRVKIALDVAASEWYHEDHGYISPKRKEHYTRDQLIQKWKDLSEKYPIYSIEDPLDQRDFEGWGELTRTIGKTVMLVGDDLFVTNEQRLREGIKRDAANAILIKPNQIGTLSETIRVIQLASKSNYQYILSHRSGETEDTSIADIAVALNAPFIKAGAPCRGERIAKYNRLLRIEAAFHNESRYGIDLIASKDRISVLLEV